MGQIDIVLCYGIRKVIPSGSQMYSLEQVKFIRLSSSLEFFGILGEQKKTGNFIKVPFYIELGLGELSVLGAPAL